MCALDVCRVCVCVRAREVERVNVRELVPLKVRQKVEYKI